MLNDDKVVYTHKFESACTCLSFNDEMTHRHSPVVGYGLKNGGIGCLELTRDTSVIMWSLEGTQTNGSSVAVIKTLKFKEDQSNSMVVARDDGTIEIFSYEHGSPFPLLRFEIKIDESITSLDIGYISSSFEKEVLLSSYSGKIMSLVPTSIAKNFIVVQESASKP